MDPYGGASGPPGVVDGVWVPSTEGEPGDILVEFPILAAGLVALTVAGWALTLLDTFGGGGPACYAAYQAALAMAINLCQAMTANNGRESQMLMPRRVYHSVTHIP